MDLGFAGLIDKIEERFGKLIANLLMLALVFVVFAWALETLASIYVSGTKLWEGSGFNAILGFGKLAVVHVILICVTGIVCYAIFQRIKTKAINRIEQVATDAKNDFEDFRDEQVDEVRQRMEGMRDEVRQRMEGMRDEFLSQIRSYITKE